MLLFALGAPHVGRQVPKTHCPRHAVRPTGDLTHSGNPSAQPGQIEPATVRVSLCCREPKGRPIGRSEPDGQRRRDPPAGAPSVERAARQGRHPPDHARKAPGPSSSGGPSASQSTTAEQTQPRKHPTEPRSEEGTNGQTSRPCASDRSRHGATRHQTKKTPEGEQPETTARQHEAGQSLAKAEDEPNGTSPH